MAQSEITFDVAESAEGGYVSVEPFHLFRYVDEEAFLYNTRKIVDGTRFTQVVTSTYGRRLTYRQLVGAA